MTEHQNIHHLSYEDKEVILVGTAHVSKESVELVDTVIKSEKPDTVCVELCQSRYQTILQKDRWENMDIMKVIKEKKAFLLLSNLILVSFQKRIAEKLEVEPGQEMLTAIETGKAVGAEIHLADREVRTTLSRTWRLIGFWTRIRLLAELLFSFGSATDIEKEDIEKMKQQDILESLLAELEKSLPTVRQTLIDERDQYLAQKIRTAPGKKIVAVVGAGHVPGIQQYWEQDIDLEKLETLPPKGKVTSIIKWVIPVGIILFVVMGFSFAGSAAGTNMILSWIIANSVLAGLGAVLALAHPITIFSAMAAAPLTSLNPMIAAGWVSGLVEAFARKPLVKDFQALADDILTVKGFWKNKITRILLVVLFTNLGSALGTFVAIPLMVRVFG
ncbi:TraB/GumN family protein [candidate division CSSED10-310 bacterium]|uniref:TraB/GumN family protein n=1 Tax=candidate division CSSED10-310 bacterium TaxID=2855610 RepID=A0ABV6Z716_UNCC1